MYLEIGVDGPLISRVSQTEGPFQSIPCIGCQHVWASELMMCQQVMCNCWPLLWGLVVWWWWCIGFSLDESRIDSQFEPKLLHLTWNLQFNNISRLLIGAWDAIKGFRLVYEFQNWLLNLNLGCQESHFRTWIHCKRMSETYWGTHAHLEDKNLAHVQSALGYITSIGFFGIPQSSCFHSIYVITPVFLSSTTKRINYCEPEELLAVFLSS